MEAVTETNIETKMNHTANSSDSLDGDSAVPAATRKAAPAVPRHIQRIEGYPRFDTLTDETSDANSHKVTALFLLVINRGIHKMRKGDSASKNAWIELYKTAWNNDPSTPGPFAAHKMHTGNDYQNKLRTLVQRLVDHYANIYEEKARQFRENDEGPVYTDNESHAHQILLEQKAADAMRQQIKDDKKAAEELNAKINSEMEARVGALPDHRGVSAPSGIEMNDSVVEALSILGSKPKSRTGKFYVEYARCKSFVRMYTLIHSYLLQFSP